MSALLVTRNLRVTEGRIWFCEDATLGREQHTHGFARPADREVEVRPPGRPGAGEAMSGIAGIVYLDGRPLESACMDNMLNRLAQRGPDGSGAWSDRQAGLGQRMLWTTPESLGERLPCVSREGGLALTADARIDNREELICMLALKDHRPQEITDSELILAAYQKWGESCPEKLVGDFAFAIWDGHRQTLFCARDPVGARPFYYYHCPGRLFICSSQIRPLFCHPEVPQRLNELRVADHLAYLQEDTRLTFFQDICPLPAAHCLAVNTGGIRLRRYWDLDVKRELRLSSDEAYAGAFLESFSEAVRCRLRSAFPAGALLSGGLDSSSIVAVARQLLAGQGPTGGLHTFSAVFPTLARTYPAIDERYWIEAVAAQGGLETHYVEADRLDPLAPLSFDDDEP